MEDWNNGILEKTKKKNFFLTHFSTIPSFHRSNGFGSSFMV